MTLQQAARDAVMVQDACNTSGVARSLVTAIDAIRDAGKSTRNNPIVFMFAYKLMALAGAEPLALWDEYATAEAACKQMALQPGVVEATWETRA